MGLKMLQDKTRVLKSKLIKELEDYFAGDTKRIRHAKKVLKFTQKLLKKEKADRDIVIAASVLHDVGIKIAEKKYGSSAGCYQEEEGPGIAKKILIRIGFKSKDIREICQIIAHHHSPGKVNTKNFSILYDADCLVNLKDMLDSGNKDKIAKIINKVFITDTARDMAKKIYL